MPLRLVTLSVPHEAVADLIARGEENGAQAIQVFSEAREGRATLQMLADSRTRQALLDALQSELALTEDWRITLVPVETTIPYPDAEDEDEDDEDAAEEEPKVGRSGLTREEIYNAVWANTQVDRSYLTFVLLSSVVAAFGMIDDNVAVVVGAMVIAPLLGPNLALGVGVALADNRLMARAAAAIAAGVGLAFALGLVIGLALPERTGSAELLARTQVGFDGLAIALASGAAAALSLVTGISSALVGVMVAVALLPPTVAVGIFFGAGELANARDAALLLAANVVCLNLAAQAVLLTRGVSPRRWYEKRRARRAMRIGGAIWLSLLAALALLLWLRTPPLT